MTKQLYFTESYTTQMQTNQFTLTTWRDKPAVVFDETIFYPTSGGQPFDTGTLYRDLDVPLAKVIDVVIDNGTIYHVLDQTFDAPTDTDTDNEIYGTIDWPRRYDHMQQHSGQHLLSQVFYHLFGFETVSVHFGETESTLDLDVEKISPEQLAEAEAYANEIVYASTPIKAYFVNDTELDKVPLRRPPKVSGEIRIVEIEQFDYSACGGTHCNTTAEVGPIKLLRMERRSKKKQKQTRVTFLCGKRALQDYIQKDSVLQEAALLFSTDYRQVATLIERNLEQLKAAEKQIATLKEAQRGQIVAELLDTATLLDSYTVISTVWTNEDIDHVKKVAMDLKEHPNVIVLFCVVEHPAEHIEASRYSCIFTRSDDGGPHMGNVLKTTLSQFNGKGGGRPEFAQGGGSGLSYEMAEALLASAKEQLM
ncbi:MAG: DHHA1 domain-containing protein [Chloroflexota bacterium]